MLGPADTTVALLPPHTHRVVLVVGVYVVGVLVVPGGDCAGDAGEVLETVGRSSPALPALDLSDPDVPAPLVVGGAEADVDPGSEVLAGVGLQVEVLPGAQTTELGRRVLAAQIHPL